MYNKISLTIDEQITQLQARGLSISDTELAKHFLSHISYYRMAGYWWPMQMEPKEEHYFKENSKFEDVISLYNFDRELRVIIFDAIEKIEISLRTKLIYHLSHEFGAWWFQNLEIFQNVPEAVKTLAVIEEEITRSKDIFIKAHRTKHKDDLRFPPSPPYSWITQVPEEKEMHMLYIHLCCIKYLLNVIQPQNNLKIQFLGLLHKYQSVDPQALGLKINWQNEQLWLI